MKKLEILVVDLHSPSVEAIIRCGKKRKINFRPTAENPNKYARSIGDAIELVGDDDVNVEYIPTQFTNLDGKDSYLTKGDQRYIDNCISEDNPIIEDIQKYNMIMFSGSNYPGLLKLNGNRNILELHPFARSLGENVLEQAKQHGIYVVGICLGDQLLACLYGHNVIYLEHPEAGWYIGRKTSKGEQHPLLEGLPNPLILFNSHGKGVCLNGKFGETVLVTNGNGPQIKEYDERVFGSQFHLDDTFESSREYLREYDEFLGQMSRTQQPSKIDLVQEPKELYGHQMLKNLLNIVRG